jgi:hypothetical protein
MMNQPESPQSNRVTLEELLRVKRAERPSPDFWSRFEQDLRAKQLAAIIEPRPWWIKLRLPQAARTLVRYQMPVGAAAALALSFIVVREYRPMHAAADVVVASSDTKPVESVVTVSPPVSFVAGSTESVPVVASAVVVEPSRATAPKSDAVEQVPVGPGALLAMIPWAAPQQAIKTDNAEPSAVLGELSQVHFASAISPTSEHHFEGSVEVAPMLVSTAIEQQAVESAEPVVEVTPVSPREIRRNHILSNLVVADNSSDAADRAVLVQAREVVANSLTDDRLYDSVRRLGMGGDRLTLKF